MVLWPRAGGRVGAGCLPSFLGSLAAALDRHRVPQLGKLISQAAKAGGPDLHVNMRLKEVVEQAKLASLPNDIITRNIAKANEASAASFAEVGGGGAGGTARRAWSEELPRGRSCPCQPPPPCTPSQVVYECYGPGGTGFIIESLTDNTNRAASTVRAAVNRGGGKMAEPGSVMFAFARRGVIPVSGVEDEVLEAAMEAGASDVQPCDEPAGAFKVGSLCRPCPAQPACPGRPDHACKTRRAPLIPFPDYSSPPFPDYSSHPSLITPPPLLPCTHPTSPTLLPATTRPR